LNEEDEIRITQSSYTIWQWRRSTKWGRV